MGLINVPDIEDDTGADANDINSRNATITGAINGNIDSANISAGGVSTANLANSSVTTAKIADGAVTGPKLSATATGNGYLEIGRTTLSSASSSITVSSLPTYKYLRIIINAFHAGSAIQPLIRFNNDSGANYTNSITGENNGTYTPNSGNQVYLAGSVTANHFIFVDIVNVASKPKLGYHVSNRDVSTTASTPSLRHGVLTWVNTTDPISQVNVSVVANTMATDSEVIVLGKN